MLIEKFLKCAGRVLPLPGDENALRQTHVDTDVRLVDPLRNGHVPGDADQLIRLVMRQLLLGHQEINHFLDRRLIEFAITLRDVAVADLEQGAAGKDRDIQRAARHQLAIVEIAGVTPGRIAD